MNEVYILGGLVVVSVIMILYSLMPAKKDDREKILRRMSGKRQDGKVAGGQAKPQKGSAAKQMIDKVAPHLAVKPVMPKSEEDMTTLRQKLAQAGFRHDSVTTVFLASKTVLGVGLAGLSMLLAWGSGQETTMLFGIATCAGGVGFFLPDVWLWIAKNQRQELIRNGLPDSLDLLVVSVESGLGLDAGLQRVGEEMNNVHKELSEELQIATLESQMGVPRSEALLNMAGRCGVEEMSSLVAIITQAEKFGTSVAKALRNQADALRTKRRLKAEERAQKTTVKLMLPLIFFIFPSIFVVLLGPAALQLIKAFGSGGALG
jgi:tight adherence protein C